MRHSEALKAILASDPLRLGLLALLQQCNLPDCWVAAGFVRDAVWDALHGLPPQPPQGDVDIIWFDRTEASAARDGDIAEWFQRRAPDLCLSVKNQARMHDRNGDLPYSSATDAMRYWPETATAVAVRLGVHEELEINAPFGLDDLFSLRLRPGPAFRDAKRHMFDARVADKRWMERYPRLRCD